MVLLSHAEEMWGTEDVPAFSGLVWFVVFGFFALWFSCLCSSPSPAGFSPSPEDLHIPSGNLRLAQPSMPLVKSQPCVGVHSKSQSQHLPVQFPRQIHVQVQFGKRSKPIFGSLQVRLRSAVKLINTKRVKKEIFYWDMGEKNSTLEQHIVSVWKHWKFQVCPVTRAGAGAGEQLSFCSLTTN